MNNLITEGGELDPILSQYLRKRNLRKGDLAKHLSLTDNGLRYKLKSGYFSQAELQAIADFLKEDLEIFVKNKTNPDTYIDAILTKIENEWRGIVVEKNKTIEQQQFMINTMREQLSIALGKLDLSEDELPVRHLDSKKIKPLPILEEQSYQTAG